MRLFLAAAALAAALPAFALTTAALAQDAAPTQSPAPSAGQGHASPALRAARHAAREACAADIVKYCPEAAQDRGKVGECMRSHRGDVSAACRDALGNLMAAREGQ